MANSGSEYFGNLPPFTSEASEAATENRQTTLVAALDAAFARAAAEIAQRTFAALGAEPPARN